MTAWSCNSENIYLYHHKNLISYTDLLKVVVYKMLFMYLLMRENGSIILHIHRKE